MIVLSGALVLVALALLVFGAVDRNLPYVYASIGVSVLSLLLLLVSILQRRGQLAADGEQAAGAPVEVRPGTEAPERVPALAGAGQGAGSSSSATSQWVRPHDAPGADDDGEPYDQEPYDQEAHDDEALDDEALDDEAHDDEAHDDEAHDDEADDDEALEDGHEVDAHATAVDQELDDEADADEPAPARAEERDLPLDRDEQDDALAGSDDDEPDDEPDDGPSGASVLVVPGRPRYHVAGCRYLLGKSPHSLDLDAARTDGFTPCGVCKPDVVLAHATARGPDEPVEHLEATPPQPDASDEQQPQAAASPVQPDATEREASLEAVLFGEQVFGGPPGQAAAPVAGEGADTAPPAAREVEEPQPARRSRRRRQEPAVATPAPPAEAVSDEPAADHVEVAAANVDRSRPDIEDTGVGPDQALAPVADHEPAHRAGTRTVPEQPGPGSLFVVDADAFEQRAAADDSGSGDELDPGARPLATVHGGSGHEVAGTTTGPAAVDPATSGPAAPEVVTSQAEADPAAPEVVAPEAEAEPAASEVVVPQAESAEAPAAPIPDDVEPTNAAATAPEAAALAGDASAVPVASPRARARTSPAKRSPAKRSPAKAPASSASGRSGPAAKAPAASGRASSKPSADTSATPSRSSAGSAPSKRSAADEPLPPAPVRRTPVRAVRADALRLSAPVGATSTKRVAARAAVPAPAARPTTPAARPVTSAAPAAARKAPARAGQVVVIQDRERFHRSDCRFVRGVSGATSLGRASAVKQGYLPCGVCQP